MPRGPRIAAALAVALAVLVVPRSSSADQKQYLRVANKGESQAKAWWDARTGWYRARLGKPNPATLWGGGVHLFETADALAIADPTAARKKRVRWFAKKAERFWNPHLRGYSPHPGSRGSSAYFDDNGWWGAAFYDAYRATGDPRYLSSAKRALMFIDGSGWDRHGGGIWWNTGHRFHAGESLAGGVLLAAQLYHETHSPAYLRMAKKYLRWADAHVLGPDGLYDRHDTDDTPMPYVQGPIFNAYELLCQATHDHGWCDKAEALADRSLKRFPMLTMGPQYDAMFIRALVELYRLDGNRRWYDYAKGQADRAIRNGRAASGLFLNNWTGGPMSEVDTPPGELQTHAATTMVAAWLAAAKPPR